MRYFEIKHLVDLCKRTGTDTQEIDTSLTYAENKKILLDRFGIADTDEHLRDGPDDHLEALAEQWRIVPEQFLRETRPYIETEPQGPFEDWEKMFNTSTMSRPPESSGPFADWEGIFHIETPERLQPKRAKRGKTELKTSMLMPRLQAKITQSLRDSLELRSAFVSTIIRDRFGTEQKVRLFW